jgi:hypothetical protein
MNDYFLNKIWIEAVATHLKALLQYSPRVTKLHDIDLNRGHAVVYLVEALYYKQ